MYIQILPEVVINSVAVSLHRMVVIDLEQWFVNVAYVDMIIPIVEMYPVLNR